MYACYLLTGVSFASLLVTGLQGYFSFNVFGLPILQFALLTSVQTEAIPAWIHGVLFPLTWLHFARTIVIQHRCFRDNTQIFYDLAELDLETNA